MNYLIKGKTKKVFELGVYLSFDNVIFPSIDSESADSIDIVWKRIEEVMDRNHIDHGHITRKAIALYIASDIAKSIGYNYNFGDTDIITDDQKRHKYVDYTLVGTVRDDKSDVGKTISEIYWAKQKMGKASVEIYSPDEIKQKYFAKAELTDEQKRYINEILIESIKSNVSGVITIKDVPCCSDYIYVELKTLIEKELKSKGWNIKTSYDTITFLPKLKK